MLPAYLIEQMRSGQLLQHYLLASYCYYILGQSPMEDSTYDRLCVRLLSVFDKLEHQHKHLVTKEDLQAGTGFTLKDDDYPMMVQLSALEYDRRCRNGEVEAGLLRFFAENPVVAVAAPRRAVRTPPPPLQPIAKPVARRAVRAAPVPESKSTPPVRRQVRVAR